MADAALQDSFSWTIEQFRAFYDDRPDEERWELIDGVPMMQGAARISHQVIAANLQVLLNDALERSGLEWIALQRLGIDLTPQVEGYQPEPDVAVISASFAQEQRYVGVFFLAAEIISTSDHDRVRGRGPKKLDAKRAIYREHPSCEAILLIEQDSMTVHLDRREGGTWKSETLEGAGAALTIPAFGLAATVGDLYRRTPLGRGR